MIKEHSVFISYKKIDGSGLASWIFSKFDGRGVSINSERQILTAQMDLAFPSTDWKTYLHNELSTASSLIVVCSPSTIRPYRDREDFFYKEIEWWIENRKAHPPLLVALSKYKHEFVPDIIFDTWKNLQVSEIDEFIIENPGHTDSDRYTNIFIESITLSITNPYQHAGSKTSLSLIESPLQNIKGVFAWSKDRHGKYIYANELYARAAGFESPNALIGKTDFDMPWRSLANKFREGDRQIMLGDELSRMVVFEKEIMAEKVADIFVTEIALKDRSNRIVGVTGCFLDVTEGINDFVKDRLQQNEHGIFLGKEFGNEFLSNPETEVLKYLSLMLSKEKIAFLLNKNLSEIKSIIGSLLKKFQCSTEDDLLSAVIRAGLPLKIFIGKEN